MLFRSLLAPPSAPGNVVAAPTPVGQQPIKPSYGDLESPAVDLLLRGFGGREKHAPEKNTDHSLPAHVVEEDLKTNIKTNNELMEPSTPQELADKKEARRKARQQRRERQQLMREAQCKLAMQTERDSTSRRSRRRPSKDKVAHVTSHSNKDKLALSLSTPALHVVGKEQASQSTAPAAPASYPGSKQLIFEEVDGEKPMLGRQGASSGYDTGTEWHHEKVDAGARPKEPNMVDHHETCDDDGDDFIEEGSPSQTGHRGVKYTCGPKYEAGSNRPGQRSKPSRYESRRAKRYSSRRKTLNYDHYSTDQQDRSSL